MGEFSDSLNVSVYDCSSYKSQIDDNISYINYDSNTDQISIDNTLNNLVALYIYDLHGNLVYSECENVDYQLRFKYDGIFIIKLLTSDDAYVKKIFTL